MKKVTAFLPCRKGSERIPKKNVRPFAGEIDGLLKIKLLQLLKVESINKIVVSTNDDEVIEIVQKLKTSKIVLDKRPEYLALSSTSTDSLIEYVPNIIQDDHILWTHVTSPLMTSESYEMAIRSYFESLEKGENDSLMSVNSIKNFLWNEHRPINYNRGKEKWPRTQTLNNLYEVNSAIFICSREIYLQSNDRIGSSPLLYELSKIEGVDIDWPDDFAFAQFLYEKIVNNDK